MAIHAGAGYVVAVIATPYAASVDTTAEFAALTPYVNIGEVESVGTFGDVAEIITFLALANSRTRKAKGSRDAGDLEIVCGRDALDAGQVILRAAAATSFKYAFRITANDKLDANDTNSLFYFGALVATRPIDVGDANNVVRERFTLAIDTEIYETPATVVP